MSACVWGLGGYRWVGECMCAGLGGYRWAGECMRVGVGGYRWAGECMRAGVGGYRWAGECMRVGVGWGGAHARESGSTGTSCFFRAPAVYHMLLGMPLGVTNLLYNYQRIIPPHNSSPLIIIKRMGELK